MSPYHCYEETKGEFIWHREEVEEEEEKNVNWHNRFDEGSFESKAVATLMIPKESEESNGEVMPRRLHPRLRHKRPSPNDDHVVLNCPPRPVSPVQNHHQESGYDTQSVCSPFLDESSGSETAQTRPTHSHTHQYLRRVLKQTMANIKRQRQLNIRRDKAEPTEEHNSYVIPDLDNRLGRVKATMEYAQRHTGQDPPLWTYNPLEHDPKRPPSPPVSPPRMDPPHSMSPYLGAPLSHLPPMENYLHNPMRPPPPLYNPYTSSPFSLPSYTRTPSPDTTTTSSSKSSSMTTSSVDVKSQRGRPRKPATKVPLPPIYVFIRNMLHNHAYNPHVISWVHEAAGVFKINNTSEFARTWGLMKSNRSEEMNYEKLSRAMRYHYGSEKQGRKGHLAMVKEKRLVYKFGELAVNWRTSEVRQSKCQVHQLCKSQFCLWSKE